MTSSLLKVISNRWFLLILGLKVVAALVFASQYPIGYFIPFLNYFVDSGFHNPWGHFFQLDQLKMFPYPAGMLAILAVPRAFFALLLGNGVDLVTSGHLLALRVPVLLCDVGLYLILRRFCPGKDNWVLWLYWASPILFYCNYIHGQLDIIPTAFFILSAYFLTRKQAIYAALSFGFALACKTHVIVGLPFMMIYMYRQRFSSNKVLMSVGILTAMVTVLVIWPMGLLGYGRMVLNNPEQWRLFAFSLPLSPTGLTLLICPAVIFMLLLKFGGYKKLNKDIFL